LKDCKSDSADFKYDTYCGLYCGACDVILANEGGYADKLAEEWHRESEELRCHGCKTEICAIFCLKCEIRQCAQQKNVEFCFQCGKYPCTRILAFRNDKNPHHSVILKNLKIIEKRGTHHWLEEQKMRWSCPKCGERFSWYARTCENCGVELFNCEEEEKELKNK
jgi:hypothetical protein